MGSGNTKYRNLNYQSHTPEYENKSNTISIQKRKEETPPSLKRVSGNKRKI